MNRLDEIREREKKATKGPWVCAECADPDITTEDGTWITNQVCSGADDDGDSGHANGQFIAHSRADIPYLLARLDAAERALREYTSGQPYEVADAYFSEYSK